LPISLVWKSGKNIGASLLRKISRVSGVARGVMTKTKSEFLATSHTARASFIGPGFFANLWALIASKLSTWLCCANPPAIRLETTSGVKANEFFCCECGRPVPVSEDGKIIGRCRFHSEALRTKKNWVKSAFEEMHAVVDAATGPGKVITGGKNYWDELEDRVTREKKRQRLEDQLTEQRQREILEKWNEDQKI
jgi:hypothetical protein